MHPKPILFSLLLTAATVTGAQAQQLRYNTFQPPRALATVEIEEFFDKLENATDGALKGRVFPGGQLLNAPSTLKGIGDGVVDGGFVIPTFNQGELPATNVLPDLSFFVEDNLVSAAASVDTALVGCDACKGETEAANVVWLGGHAPTPWNLLCASDIEGLADVKGARIRVTGSSATRLISALGAVAVQMAPGEIAPGLQSGTIDCAMGPISWLDDYGLYDSVKTIVDYPFGVYSGTGVYVFNKRTYDGLDADRRAAIIDLIPQYVIDGTMNWSKAAVIAAAKAEEGGIKIVPADEAMVAAVEAFREAEVDTLVSEMEARGVEGARDIVELQLANIEKWKTIVGDADEDRDKLVEALRRDVYSKLQ